MYGRPTTSHNDNRRVYREKHVADLVAILIKFLNPVQCIEWSRNDYSNLTTAPIASNVFCSFSASSLERFSLSIFGNDSTNFLAWIRKGGRSFLIKWRWGEESVKCTSIRLRLGTIALTSRMTFGLAPVSKDSNFTLKIVFSFGFSYSLSISTLRHGWRWSILTAAGSSDTAAAAWATGAAAAGIAISWMFNRDYRIKTEWIKIHSLITKSYCAPSEGRRGPLPEAVLDPKYHLQSSW